MKRPTYFLNYEFNGNFEIYFNGIMISKNTEKRSASGHRYLNQYIEEKGKQNVSILLKPYDTEGKLSTNYLEEVSLEIYFSENGKNPPFKKIKKMKFPKFESPQNNVAYTWSFDAEVPYVSSIKLDGSKDLTKEDPNKLLNELVEKYNEIIYVINTGDYNKYLKISSPTIKRATNSLYYTENEIEDHKKELSKRVLSSKGFVHPLKDLHLKIHPNGKIINLITSQGKTPVYSINEEGYVKTYGFKFHKPKGSNTLEIY